MKWLGKIIAETAADGKEISPKLRESLTQSVYLAKRWREDLLKDASAADEEEAGGLGKSV